MIPGRRFKLAAFAILLGALAAWWLILGGGLDHKDAVSKPASTPHSPGGQTAPDRSEPKTAVETPVIHEGLTPADFAKVFHRLPPVFTRVGNVNTSLLRAFGVPRGLNRDLEKHLQTLRQNAFEALNAGRPPFVCPPDGVTREVAGLDTAAIEDLVRPLGEVFPAELTAQARGLMIASVRKWLTDNLSDTMYVKVAQQYAAGTHGSFSRRLTLTKSAGESDNPDYWVYDRSFNRAADAGLWKWITIPEDAP